MVRGRDISRGVLGEPLDIHSQDLAHLPPSSRTGALGIREWCSGPMGMGRGGITLPGQAGGREGSVIRAAVSGAQHCHLDAGKAAPRRRLFTSHVRWGSSIGSVDAVHVFAVLDESCQSTIAECLACRDRKSPWVPSSSMSRAGGVRCLGRLMALILDTTLLSYLNLGNFASLVSMYCKTQSGSTWFRSQQRIWDRY